MEALIFWAFLLFVFWTVFARDRARTGRRYPGGSAPPFPEQKAREKQQDDSMKETGNYGEEEDLPLPGPWSRRQEEADLPLPGPWSRKPEETDLPLPGPWDRRETDPEDVPLPGPWNRQEEGPLPGPWHRRERDLQDQVPGGERVRKAPAGVSRREQQERRPDPALEHKPERERTAETKREALRERPVRDVPGVEGTDQVFMETREPCPRPVQCPLLSRRNLAAAVILSEVLNFRGGRQARRRRGTR
ncbi:hypothetical protein [Desulfofundulus kuznetsovii]